MACGLLEYAVEDTVFSSLKETEVRLVEQRSSFNDTRQHIIE